MLNYIKIKHTANMNTLLALTITLPDWLFCGPFWCGFFTAIALGAAFLAYALSDFKPFGL